MPVAGLALVLVSLLAITGGLALAAGFLDPSPRILMCRLGESGKASGAVTNGRTGPEATFMAENQAAMQRMMDDMAISPEGDVDRDFVAMMVPHHQGAIDMAMAELRYGRNELLRRIAQEIIVTQRQEIRAMNRAEFARLAPGVRQTTARPSP